MLKLQGLKGEGATETVVYLSGIILFTIVIDRLGKRIAVERAEKWLKLLRATPLLWACGAFGLLAAWSYQRDRTV
ncbi:MAG: hypothetical protein V7L26_08635 [Nostoc sp.]